MMLKRTTRNGTFLLYSSSLLQGLALFHLFGSFLCSLFDFLTRNEGPFYGSHGEGIEEKKKLQDYPSFQLVMSAGIPEPEITRPNLTFFNTRHTRTQHSRIRVYPNPPKPDFFYTRPITNL